MAASVWICHADFLCPKVGLWSQDPNRQRLNLDWVEASLFLRGDGVVVVTKCRNRVRNCIEEDTIPRMVLVMDSLFLCPEYSTIGSRAQMGSIPLPLASCT